VDKVGSVLLKWEWDLHVRCRGVPCLIGARELWEVFE
jgi:hypothetical protein